MEGEKTQRVLSVVTTVGSAADARGLAALLLERRLAACVQVEPGLVSHYVWQGRQCEEPEVRLTIKTLPDRADALQAFFSEHHPYELPQFLSTEMVASAAYAAWVSESVAGDPRPRA
jgi:periplasmic divalent cation tolerance protein